MKRLTTKIKGSNNYCEFELKNAKYKNLFELSSNREIENYVNTDLTIAIDKLGKLEDIEQEIGIDLITLFKSLEGIWVKSTNDDVYYVGSPYLCFSENEKRELELQFRVGDTWYKIKDCGKTWALIRKALENGND